jgi:hypothetical protein
MPANATKRAKRRREAVQVRHLLVSVSLGMLTAVALRLLDSPAVYQALRPTDTAQHTKALRLNDERNVELLRYGVHPERHAAN